MKKMKPMQFQLMNLCLYEPKSDELLQLSYLSKDGQELTQKELEKIGGLQEIGFAKNKEFLSLGIYPVRVSYEKKGKVVRARENILNGLKKIERNTFLLTGENAGYISRMCRKRRTA